MITATDAFRKGYVERSDRRQRFPWNADMEPVLTMSAAELRTYFQDKFKPYEGHFILE